MTEWLLAHQPFLISLIVINGTSIAVLIVGFFFTPGIKE
jgi:hypothetical protein